MWGQDILTKIPGTDSVLCTLVSEGVVLVGDEFIPKT